jgi:hypothetical protein
VWIGQQHHSSDNDWRLSKLNSQKSSKQTIKSIRKPGYMSEHFPNSVLPQPFYYGPLRKGNPHFLIVPGLVKGIPESPYGKAYFWMYKEEDGQLYHFRTREVSDMAAMFRGVLAFDALGDTTKQIGVYTVGVGNIYLHVYGFRGKDCVPKRLYSSEGRAIPEAIEEQGRYVVVEHWWIGDLLHWGYLHPPLPGKLQGYVCAKRTFRYDSKRDAYRLFRDFEPDIEREKHLTPAELADERKLTQKVIKMK